MGHTTVSAVSIFSDPMDLEHGAKENYCNYCTFAAFNRVVDTKTSKI